MRILEFKEKLKERTAYEESEKSKANTSNEDKVAEEAASSEKQSEEVTDEKAKNLPETTDALEETFDHFQMNGELESHIANGNATPTKATDEDNKFVIDSLESQTESKENTARDAEPALVNRECKHFDELTLVEKENSKN